MPVSDSVIDKLGNPGWLNWFLTGFSVILAFVFEKLHSRYNRIIADIELIRIDVLKVNQRIDLLSSKMDSNLALANTNIDNIKTILQYIEGKN